MSGIALVTYTKATTEARNDIVIELTHQYVANLRGKYPELTDLELEHLCRNNAEMDVDWLLKCEAREILRSVAEAVLPPFQGHKEPEIRALIAKQRRALGEIRFKYLDN